MAPDICLHDFQFCGAYYDSKVCCLPHLVPNACYAVSGMLFSTTLRVCRFRDSLAVAQVRSGDAEVVVAGGTEACIDAVSLGAFCRRAPALARGSRVVVNCKAELLSAYQALAPAQLTRLGFGIRPGD